MECHNCILTSQPVSTLLQALIVWRAGEGNGGMFRSSARNEGINKTDAVWSWFACGLFFIFKWDFFQKIGPELTELRILFPYRNKRNCCYLFLKKFHVTETLLECQVCGSVNTLNMITTLRRIQFGKDCSNCF